MITRRQKQPALLMLLAALLITGVTFDKSIVSARLQSTKRLPATMFDPSGNYRIASATDPDGASYGGTVAVSRIGDAYRVRWTTGDASYEGIGVPVDDTLAVGWGSGKGRRGAVAYRINGGRLSGRWTMSDMNGAVGTEELDGSPGLQGSYRIVSSTIPGSSGGYTGTVNISSNGDTYIIEWRLNSGENYKGVGIRQGDVLAVGWGLGPDSVAVASYKQKGALLQGVWAMPGGKRLGTERLSKG